MIPRRAVDLLGLAMALTLAVHAGHMPPWLTAPLALVLAGRWWQLRRGAPRVPGWLKLPLVLLLLAAIVSAYGTLFGQAPGSAMAVGLLILKLLETSRPRDVRSAVIFGSFTLMSALLFSQGMAFTALVLLGLVPNLAALSAVLPRGPAPPWREEWLPLLGRLAVILPLALFAFFFIPRLASPLWGAPGEDSARTGLSDTMSPGNFTELLIDDSPAMRVSFAGAPPAPRERYFRAWVMSDFDGRTWSRQRRTSPPAEALEFAADFAYDIQLEPDPGHVLPVLEMPTMAPAGTRLAADRMVFSFRPLSHTRPWHLRAATRYRLQPAPDPRTERRNLALPEGFNPRARELASTWRERHGDDAQAIAAAALARFHDDGFSYTLAPAPLGRHSIDDFLFGTREGFCEHYASSFTFLLRAAGVPARVVTGYQGGYWNERSAYLLVRNSDAHAWTEAWIDGRGWVRFDPTAAVRPERVQLGSWSAAGGNARWYQAAWIMGLRNQWDIVNRGWNRIIVAFDQARQRGMLQPFGVPEATMQRLTLLLALGCSLLLALATALTVYRRRPADPLLAARARLERHLARLGVQRRLNEGPRDFMTRACAALPAHAAMLERVYGEYMQLRYGPGRPGRDAVSAWQRLVREAISKIVLQ